MIKTCKCQQLVLIKKSLGNFDCIIVGYFLSPYTKMPSLTEFLRAFYHCCEEEWAAFLFCPFQLSFSPTTPMSSHGRVLSLLIAMLLSCCGLAVVCCVTGYTHGMHTLAFMAAEVRCWTQGCSDYICIFKEVRGLLIDFTHEMMALIFNLI